MPQTPNTTTDNNTVIADTNAVLPVLPERTVVEAAEAQKRAARCSDCNDSRRDSRNFKNLEIKGVTFQGEDLSGCEAHYSKFTDCEFSECNLSSIAFFYTVFENCRFTNCQIGNSNFSFAVLDNASFTSCNMNRAHFPFARGSFSCQSCMMSRSTALNASLKMTLTDCIALYFEGNAANLELEVLRSSLRGAEFNDSTVKGTITGTDLTRSEFNRADVNSLKITDCPRSNMETEDSAGFDDEFSEDDLEDLFDSADLEDLDEE